jgi:cytidylate kinase
MLMAYHLEKRWKKLHSSALYRMKTLHATKVKFSQMTMNDIDKFKKEVSCSHFFFNFNGLDAKLFIESYS